MTKQQIKPCPFCGSDNVGIGSQHIVCHVSKWWVLCGNCGSSGSIKASEDKAIEAWGGVSLSQQDHWQPIETAPQDGSSVLLYYPKGLFSRHIVCIGHFYKDSSSKIPRPYWDTCELVGSYDLRRFPPTHWQPLPAEPRLGIVSRELLIGD